VPLRQGEAGMLPTTKRSHRTGRWALTCAPDHATARPVLGHMCQGRTALANVKKPAISGLFLQIERLLDMQS
jgi:hypothetical protein